MQHYGLPTRLLDWTESITVAAFFAVCCEEEGQCGPAVIWALGPYKLNAQYIRHEVIYSITNKKYVRPVVLGLFPGYQDPEMILAVSAQEIDPRMMQQQSAFTIHGLRKPLEDLHVPGAESFLIKFVIPADARQSLARDLRRMGIKTSVLFPDLDHLAQDIAQDALAPNRDAKPNA